MDFELASLQQAARETTGLAREEVEADFVEYRAAFSIPVEEGLRGDRFVDPRKGSRSEFELG